MTENQRTNLRRITSCAMAAVVVCGVLHGANAKADDDKKAGVENTDQAEKPSVQEEMRDLMQRTDVHVLSADDDERATAQLVEQALISYVELERKIEDSTVWIWTHAGRPVAAQKLEVNRQTGGNWTYCFASLSEKQITVKWPNVSEAFRTSEGVVYQTIAEAPAPRASKALRTQQLRALSRQFEVAADQGPERKHLYDMRLLPRPIYSYEAPETGTIQGAVFGYASGTNPDALIVIELRKADDGTTSWVFAPIRMTSGGVTMKRKDELVFSSEGEWPRRTFPTWMYAFVGRGLRR